MPASAAGASGASTPAVSTGRRLRIAIIGDVFSFPHGTGATARMAGMAQGLRAAGAEVQVLVTCPTEDARDPKNTQRCGTHEGIPFEYTAGTTIRPRSAWRMRWLGMRSAARQLAWLAAPGQERFDAIILSTASSITLPVVIGGMSRLRRTALLYEGCELPFVYHTLGRWGTLAAALYTRWLLSLFDGVIVISEYLAGYFSARVRSSAKLVRLPILVDVSQYAGAQAPSDAPPYVLYTGSLYPAKGVEQLVRAFVPVAAAHPACELWIAGDAGPGDRERLQALSRCEGIEKRVRWLGLIPRAELPELLAGAAVLAAPQRSGAHSDAAFPTKLGEYLASGRPVVTSRVGEIDRYLTDGVEAYLVPPDDAAALAAAIGRVLDHPEEAAAVGVRGQQAASRHFECRALGRRLLQEIEALVAVRRRGRR